MYCIYSIVQRRKKLLKKRETERARSIAAKRQRRRFLVTYEPASTFFIRNK